ncbi:MAG: chemotaxis protein CheW [Mycobacteriales bacterium]
MSHVVIRIGASRFALSMDSVAQVGKLPGFTRVPGTPSWVAGVANWRGRVLGVVDLRSLLGLPDDGATRAKDARLVILASGPVQVGVLADRVDGVIDIEDDDLEPTMLSLGDEAGSLLMGQANDAEGPIGVLDDSAVFALRSRLAGARRAG